ncbi:MAG: hypothetical protein IAF38_01245, partial [Bacteroidia bacterium]|nr:hypothetical protein [Bacteroidia bacterium]
MKKTFLLLALCVQFLFSFSQTNFILKKELTKADSLYIKKEIRDQLFPFGRIRFEYNTLDYENTIRTQDVVFDQKAITDLESKLNGSFDDTKTYYDLAYGYKHIYNYKKGNYCLDKAMEKAGPQLAEKPDDIELNLILAKICFLGNLTTEATKYLETVIKKDPHNKEAKLFLISLTFSASGSDAAIELAKKNIALEPDSSWNYRMLPLFYLSKITLASMAIKDKMKQAESVKNKSIDELADLSLLKNAYKSHKKDKQFETTYRLAELCVLFAKAYTLSMA